MIKEYITNTHAPTHSSYALELLEVFNIERHGEPKRYKPFRKLPNRKLLWHGSRTTNFAGILSQGLRIAPPEAPVVSMTSCDIIITIVTNDIIYDRLDTCLVKECTLLVSVIGQLLIIYLIIFLLVDMASKVWCISTDPFCYIQSLPVC